jgi:hypothetical protein
MSEQELLAKLHTTVAEDLLRRVQSGEATSQELSVAVKFLKDNGIEAQATPDSPLANLIDSLPEFDDEKLHSRH